MNRTNDNNSMRWTGIGVMILLALAIVLEPMTVPLRVAADGPSPAEAAAAAAEKKAHEEVLQQQAAVQQHKKDLRDRMAQSGSTLKSAEVSDYVLQQAEKIDAETPLDFRAALAVSFYSKYTGIKPSLLLAVIEQESKFNQYAVGSHQDRGYMQLIPATERGLVRSYGSWLNISYNPKRIFEPEYNLALGAAHLSGIGTASRGDSHRLLSTYNRGGGSVQRYYNSSRTYATSYSRSVLEKEQRYLVLNQ